MLPAKGPFGGGSGRGFKGEPVGGHTESPPGLPPWYGGVMLMTKI